LNDDLGENPGTPYVLTFTLQVTKLNALAGIKSGNASALSKSNTEYLLNRTECKNDLAMKSVLFIGLAYVIALIFLVAPYLIIHLSLYSVAGITLYYCGECISSTSRLGF